MPVRSETDGAATSLRGRLRGDGGGLRNFGVGAANAELLDAASERVRVQAEDAGRPAHALDKPPRLFEGGAHVADRKSTRLNSSHQIISYAVFCLKKKNAQKSL